MRLVALSAVLVALLATAALAQVVAPFNVTRLYRTDADFARAIQPYQQAVQANARNARAQYWLGYAYVFIYRQSLAGAAPYASGYLTRAVQPLQEAIKLEPTMIQAYLALHDAYALLGEYGKADALVEEMRLRMRPGWLAPINLN